MLAGWTRIFGIELQRLPTAFRCRDSLRVRPVHAANRILVKLEWIDCSDLIDDPIVFTRRDDGAVRDQRRSHLGDLAVVIDLGGQYLCCDQSVSQVVSGRHVDARQATKYRSNLESADGRLGGLRRQPTLAASKFSRRE